MASETPRVCAMFGCKFIPGVKKCYHSFPKDAILKNIHVLKSAREQMVSTPIQLEYAVFILVTLKYVLFNLVKYKPSVNTKHKFG